jgi:hypothetical protein
MDRLGIVLMIAALCATSCSRQDRVLEEHRKSFESLSATTAAIAHGWLDGSTSGTYTSAALEQTLRMAEQERIAIAQSAKLLIDPRGAALAAAAADLSNSIAAMFSAVRSADGDMVRRQVATLPFRNKS